VDEGAARLSMTDPNAETLLAYDEGWQRYLLGTPAVPLDIHGPWLPDALAMRPYGCTVLEIGSGPGHDAAQMEIEGIDVERTDACEPFVAYLEAQGHKARVLNVLTDDIGGPYGMIYAFAVFQHMTGQQLVTALRNCRDALAPGGVLAFSARRGLTPEWAERKGLDKRLFWYWQPGRLWDKVEFAGLTVRAMHQDVQHGQDAEQADKTWLLVTAVRE
jgi:SAM-dependent methyltransferase